MDRLFDLFGPHPMDIDTDPPGGAESLDDPEGATEGDEEILDVSEKLNDPEWADAKIRVTVDGEPKVMTRGEFYRGKQKVMHADNLMRNAREVLLRGKTPRAQSSRGQDPGLSKAITQLTDHLRGQNKQDAKDDINAIWADDTLALEDKTQKAIQMLYKRLEQSGKPSQEVIELKRQLASFREDRSKQERENQYKQEFETEWDEVAKEYPHFDDDDSQRFIVNEFIYWDNRACQMARDWYDRVGYYGGADWDETLAFYRKEYGKTMMECAKNVDKTRLTANTRRADRKRSMGVGPGKAGAGSKKNIKIVDMNSKEFDVQMDKL